MAGHATNPMATRTDELKEVKTAIADVRRDVGVIRDEVRSDISKLKDTLLPAVARIEQQMEHLSRSNAEVCSDIKTKASTTDLATLRATSAMEIAQLRNDLQSGEENATGMFDNHDERLRAIETSNGKIETALSGLTDLVAKMDGSLTWIRDRTLWIVGAGAGIVGLAEFGAHFWKH